MNSTAALLITTERVRTHYDRVSKWHGLVYGAHMHHGYWEGEGSIATAQERLTARLAGLAGISRGSAVLDVGCGPGGSAFWLAEHLGCSVLGVTISYKQARIAVKNCQLRRLDRAVQFAVLDANTLSLASGSFDIVWVLECAEHLAERDLFVHKLARVLKRDGKLILAGWAVPERDLLPTQQALLGQLCSAMLCYRPPRESEYLKWMRASHLTDIVTQDWTTSVSPTVGRWLKATDGFLLRPFLRFAHTESQRFVEGFRALEQAYRTGAL